MKVYDDKMTHDDQKHITHEFVEADTGAAAALFNAFVDVCEEARDAPGAHAPRLAAKL